MNKTKKLLSLIAAAAISVSAFAGMAIQAGAEESAIVNEDFGTDGTWTSLTGTGYTWNTENTLFTGQVAPGQSKTHSATGAALRTKNNASNVKILEFDNEQTGVLIIDMSAGYYDINGDYTVGELIFNDKNNEKVFSFKLTSAKGWSQNAYLTTGISTSDTEIKSEIDGFGNKKWFNVKIIIDTYNNTVSIGNTTLPIASNSNIKSINSTTTLPDDQPARTLCLDSFKFVKLKADEVAIDEGNETIVASATSSTNKTVYTATAKDTEKNLTWKDGMTWSIQGEAPAGVTMSSSGELNIDGTAAAETGSVTIQVDADGKTDEKNISYTVSSTTYALSFSPVGDSGETFSNGDVSYKVYNTDTTEEVTSWSELAPGNYRYEATADGYKKAEDTFQITNAAKEVPVTLKKYYTPVFSAKDDKDTDINGITYTLYSDADMSDEIEKENLLVGSKYYYKATVEDDTHFDTTGSFTVAGDKTKTTFAVDVTIYGQVTVQLKAGDNVVTEKTTTSKRTENSNGKYTYYYPAYVKYGDDYYKVEQADEENPVYGKDIDLTKAAQTTNVNYTKADNVVFFQEAEQTSVPSSNRATWKKTGTSVSSGDSIAVNKTGLGVEFTVNIPKSGKYSLDLNVVPGDYAVDVEVDGVKIDTKEKNAASPFHNEIYLNADEHKIRYAAVYSTVPSLDYLLVTQNYTSDVTVHTAETSKENGVEINDTATADDAKIATPVSATIVANKGTNFTTPKIKWSFICKDEQAGTVKKYKEITYDKAEGITGDGTTAYKFGVVFTGVNLNHDDIGTNISASATAELSEGAVTTP